MPTALILGVAGGTGAYLARLLQARGYVVWGGVDDPATADLSPLEDLGVAADLKLRGIAAAGLDGLVREARADEIYDLRPAGGGTGLLIEALGLLPRPPKLFIDASGEVFGDTGDSAATETTLYQPMSNLGHASATAATAVASARAGGLFAVTGLVFDHGSRLGPHAGPAFEIIDGVRRVAAGLADRVQVADPDSLHDWGWTPEYVDAMWRTLQAGTARDYVMATGTRLTIADFAGHACDYFKVERSRCHEVPGPARSRLGDPALARRELGWRAHTFGRDLVRTLCEGYAARPIG